MDSYIDKWNAFMENSFRLSPNEIVLYMRLFQIGNLHHWPEWIGVDNLLLCEITGLQERAIIRAKRDLKEKGFIDFIQGKKGTKSRYKLLQLETFTSNLPVNTPVKPTVKDTKNPLFTGRNTGKLPVNTPVKPTVLIRDRYRQENNNISKVTDFYQNNIQTAISPVVFQKLEQDVEDFTEEWVMKAMECAATQSYEKKNMNYIHGILENWKQSGLAKPWERKKKKPDGNKVPNVKRPEYVDEIRRRQIKESRKGEDDADSNGIGCTDRENVTWLAACKTGTFNGFERQTITG